MSYVNYISFPREPDAFPMPSDEHKVKIKKSGLFRYKEWCNYVYLSCESPLHDCNIGFHEPLDKVVFNGCFVNPFVYEFYSGIMPGYNHQLSLLSSQDISRERKAAAARNLNEEYDKWQRQKLYECLRLILRVGEFSEIYTVRSNHIDFCFGPSKTCCTVTLEDVLYVSNVLHLQKYDTSAAGSKLTVLRTS